MTGMKWRMVYFNLGDLLGSTAMRVWRSGRVCFFTLSRRIQSFEAMSVNLVTRDS